MTASKDVSQWQRYKKYLLVDPSLGFSLDVSRVRFDETLFSQPRIPEMLRSMRALVAGELANPDERRMVGHYWLRNPELAPNPELREQIESTITRIKAFAQNVHEGRIAPPGQKRFRSVLVIGIGGSALGPQLVADALGTISDPVKLYFFDNTDPDGMDRVLSSIHDLSETLVLVVSKSGGTKETRNGQIAAQRAFERAGLSYAKSFVAVTGEGSELDTLARRDGWLARFPMWDWVGGRTSEFSAVGLLPAALQGLDIDGMLEGARLMDQLTSREDVRANPAALLALMWYTIGEGRGLKDMVVLPYKDRLQLMSRYLQQLVMESLGKELDLAGNRVNQGLAVYGNKGSTDQHAYVQQLRDGLNNFFVVFLEVLRDDCEGSGASASSEFEVEPAVTVGDYLSGFLQGTRSALDEKDRQSITITLAEVSSRTVAALIALFERAVGFYATLIGVNAYHQPGVEAGKKAAGEVLALQRRVLEQLSACEQPATVDELAGALGVPESAETLFKILSHLAANGRVAGLAATSPFDARFYLP